jgi:hypothetical protein
MSHSLNIPWFVPLNCSESLCDDYWHFSIRCWRQIFLYIPSLCPCQSWFFSLLHYTPTALLFHTNSPPVLLDGFENLLSWKRYQTMDPGAQGICLPVYSVPRLHSSVSRSISCICSFSLIFCFISELMTIWLIRRVRYTLSGLGQIRWRRRQRIPRDGSKERGVRPRRLCSLILRSWRRSVGRDRWYFITKMPLTRHGTRRWRQAYNECCLIRQWAGNERAQNRKEFYIWNLFQGSKEIFDLHLYIN